MSRDEYFLGEACRNSFVLFDDLYSATADENLLKLVHSYLVKENRDDSLILVDGRAHGDALYARMIVLGFDGEFGEFCGNGSRVCAAYLFSHYPQFKRFYLVTGFGNLELNKYGNDIYSIKLSLVRSEMNPKFIARPELFKESLNKSLFQRSREILNQNVNLENELTSLKVSELENSCSGSKDPRDLKNGLVQGFLKREGKFYSIEIEGKSFSYMEAIEPHLVIREKMSDEELTLWGKRINARKDIFPLGINVNAYYEMEEGVLNVKTYERGVQRLTLSCGTGSSSCSTHYLKGEKGKVKVYTPGGILDIRIDEGYLELKGPAILSSKVEIQHCC